MKIPLLTCHISLSGDIHIKFKSTKRSMYNIPDMCISFYLNSCIPFRYLTLTYNIELGGGGGLLQTQNKYTLYNRLFAFLKKIIKTII